MSVLTKVLASNLKWPNLVGPAGGLAVGNLVKWDASAATWVLTDADNSLYPADGVVTGACGANGYPEVCSWAILQDADWSFTPGALLYTDDATAGGFTESAPGTSTDCLQPIGRAISATKVVLHITPAYTLHA